MRVRDLIDALKSVPGDAHVWITTKDDESAAAAVTKAGEYLRILSHDADKSSVERTLFDERE